VGSSHRRATRSTILASQADLYRGAVPDAERAHEVDVEWLRREVERLRSELAAERRLRRLITEAHRAGAATVVEGSQSDARVVELEGELRLIRLSRAYRAGQAARRVLAWVTNRRANAAVAQPPPVMRAAPPRLPRGSGRPVVFFVPWLAYGGGADQFVRDIAAALVQDDRTVAVVVTAPRSPELVDATAATRDVTPHVFESVGELPRDEAVAFVTDLVYELDAPILFNVGSTWLYAHLDEVRAAAGTRVTVVDQLFNHIGHVASNVAAGSAVDLTVTAFDGLRRLLVEHFHVDRPVVTIHVGLRAVDAPPRPERRSTLPVVGWLARLSPEKRPLRFVELARALDGRACFVLGGTGPQSPEVERASAGIASLEIRGFVDDGVSFLADADLIVLTSEVEGISVVAMEALAVGVPVVATDVGGMADLIQPGVNGELVEPDDPAALVAVVAALLEDRARLRELQQRVRRDRLPREFTADEMVSRFAEILR
jgi:glycosyltransferase involved in cell wall biosynthesis